jgi:hypothetical protein
MGVAKKLMRGRSVGSLLPRQFLTEFTMIKTQAVA